MIACPTCGAPWRVAEPTVAMPSTLDQITAQAIDLKMPIVAGTVAQADAAVLIGKSVSTLERWRREGSHPPLPWLRRGTQIFYRLQALADWLDARGEQSFE